MRLLTRALVVLSVISLVLLAVMTYLVLNYEFISTKKPAACGGAVGEVPSLPLDEKNSRFIFSGSCASCHHQGFRKIIGPGLGNLASRVPSEDWFVAFVQREDSMITAGDSHTLAINAAYPKVEWMHREKLIPEADLRQLFADLSN